MKLKSSLFLLLLLSGTALLAENERCFNHIFQMSLGLSGSNSNDDNPGNVESGNVKNFNYTILDKNLRIGLAIDYLNFSNRINSGSFAAFYDQAYQPLYPNNLVYIKDGDVSVGYFEVNTLMIGLAASILPESSNYYIIPAIQAGIVKASTPEADFQGSHQEGYSFWAFKFKTEEEDAFDLGYNTSIRLGYKFIKPKFSVNIHLLAGYLSSKPNFKYDAVIANLKPQTVRIDAGRTYLSCGVGINL